MITAHDIVEHPEKIFARLPLVHNLKEHLIRVAAVADTISTHWKGAPIDRDKIVATCLLHDVGNIMRMDFDSPKQREYMQHDYDKVETYRALKKKIASRYGTDPVLARTGLLQELQVDPELIAFIENSRGKHLARMLREYDYPGMIYLYADNRAVVEGICTLAERIADAKLRYPGYYETPERLEIDFEQKLWEMERALQAHCTIPLDSITNELIADSPLWNALH